MLLRKVEDTEEDDKRIIKLYEEAFPEDERAPYWMLKRRVKQGRAEHWNFFIEEKDVTRNEINKEKDNNNQNDSEVENKALDEENTIDKKDDNNANSDSNKKEKWCGWIYLVRYKDIAYIFFFAIDASLRGKGYGTLALKALIQKYQGYRIFLGLEDWKDESAPNLEQRRHRHQFYKNCGLEELPHKLFEVNNTFLIMGVGGAVEPKEYKDMINYYHGWLLRFFIDMRMVD